MNNTDISFATPARPAAVGFRPAKQNPDSNTGSDSRGTIGIDYLTLTALLPTAEMAREAIEVAAYLFLYSIKLLIPKPGEHLQRGRTYQHRFDGVNGFQAGYSEPGATTGGVSVILILPGRVLARLPQLHIQDNCRRLYRDFGFMPTRADVALDDFDRSLDYHRIEQAIVAKNYTGFRKARPHGHPALGEGWTWELGRRSSEKFVRIYDKFAESGGEINAIRMELELKDEYAHAFWLQYLDRTDDLPQWLCNRVLESVDFIYRTGDKNVVRAKPLEWWAEFIAKFWTDDGIKLRPKRIKATLQSKVSWVNRSVVTSLAVLREVMGGGKFDDWLRDMVASGKQRMNRYHMALIKQHKINLEEMQVFNDIITQLHPQSQATVL